MNFFDKGLAVLHGVLSGRTHKDQMLKYSKTHLINCTYLISKHTFQLQRL